MVDLVPSIKGCFQHLGHQMAALAGIGLIRYTKSQQTAEMNASYSNHASMAEELQIALIPQRCSNGQGHALCGIAAMESGPTAFEQNTEAAGNQAEFKFATPR